jgi:hypothetical protein
LFKCYNSFADIPTTTQDYETLLHCYKSNVFSGVTIMYPFSDEKGFFPIFNVNREEKLIMLGNKRSGAYILIRGSLMEIKSENSIPFQCRSKILNLSGNDSNFVINNNTDDMAITIPYRTDLTDLETRLEALESGSEGITIEDIKTINPYLGINEYYTLSEYDQIPFAKDEKFFQYYRHIRSGDLYCFGVVVRAYMDIAATLNLFKIDKCSNIINIGCDQYSNSMMGTNGFSSSTTIARNLHINNTSGINIVTNGYNARLKVNNNDVSIEDTYYPNKNIVLSRGLRTFITEDALIFHKPGDTITDNDSANRIILPFSVDFSNYNDVENLESFTQQINDGVVELSEKIEEVIDDFGQLETAVIGINDRVKTLEEGSGSNDLITFRQSIIDSIIMAYPYGNLFDKN